MLVKPKAELLTLAAEETLTRIRQDREELSPHFAKVVDYIADHLFDEGLDINQIKRACGVTNNTMVRLGVELGHTAYVYISMRRAEVARKLLRDTQLKVEEISKLLGYSNTRSFGRAFERICGKRPKAYREQLLQQAASPSPARDLESLEIWRQAHAGDLEGHVASCLVEHLQRLYALGSRSQPTAIFADGRDFERFMAFQTWEAIRDQPTTVQLATVRFNVRFSTPALFDLLREKSRLHSRRNRQRGVELAEVAIASLESIASALGEAVLDLRARGWAWLGNVRRLAGDFSGAEDAFAFAEAAWERPREKKDPLVQGEILHLKATLLLSQRKLDDALALERKAIAVFRSNGDEHYLARALAVRANIAGYSGRHRAALDDLTSALSLTEQHDHDLRLSILSNLATIHTWEGEYSEAAKLLPEARRLSRERAQPVAYSQLTWVAGILEYRQGSSRKAELLLANARNGFLQEKESAYAAVVTLDLAALYLKDGKATRAIEQAAHALPIFEASGLHPEALEGKRVLAEALADHTLSLDQIQKIRESVKLLCQHRDIQLPQRL